MKLSKCCNALITTRRIGKSKWLACQACGQEAEVGLDMTKYKPPMRKLDHVKIWEYIEENPGLRRAEYAHRFRCSEDTINSIIREYDKKEK